MSFRKRINLFLYKTFPDNAFINNVTKAFYKSILIPLVTFILKLRFPQIKSIYIRHSLTEEHFNAFLSDIDLTIVIENDTSSEALLKTFIKIKKILIMFDFPEVYSSDEFNELKKLKGSSYWDVLYTLWSIRKINWNYQSIETDPDELNTIKKNRSIKISFDKILIAGMSPSKKYLLHDFKALNFLSSTKFEKNDLVSFYSLFLETDKVYSLKIFLDEEERNSFLSIMPGERGITPFLDLRKAITLYEILITKASIRLDEANGLNSAIKKSWLTQLENCS